MTLQISIRYADIPPDPYYFVLWDWLRDDFTGDILRPNLPCVFRCGDAGDTNNGHYLALNYQWQFFWFGLCCKVVYGRRYQELTTAEYDWLSARWTSVGGNTTAFTNGHGLDVKANYVRGERIGEENPAIYTLACGGASLRGAVAGADLRVEHFDGNQPPPPVESIDPYTDERVFFATTITSVKADGGYKVNRFSQFAGADVPIPLVAKKDIYFPLKYLRKVTGPKPSPYFPS